MVDMRRQYKYLICFLVGALIGAGAFWLFSRYRGITHADKFDQVLQLVDRYYVDSVDIEQLRTDILPYMLGSLDPHSTYIPPLESEMEEQRLEGQFEGIGIIYNIITDTIVVDQVFAGGPSETAGLEPGDRILTCDGKSLLGERNNQDTITSALRGPKGSVAHLSILRRHTRRNVSVVRGPVPIRSIDVSYMLTPTIGLMQITTWARTTYDEFIQHWGELQRSGAKALILDLRDNTGGYMDAAVAVANEFLSKDQLIVYTEGRTMPREDVVANGEGMLQKLPLVVLVNENSASSSEIFSGAMQDHDRAMIVGRQTYGKGLVQQPFTFPDHSSVRLTVARYYTPSGRNIQRPYEQGSLSSIEESLMSVSGIKPVGDYADTLSLTKQKQREYHSDKGRLLFSGYGIMPDIFVPQDTAMINAYAARLIMSGAMQEFAFYFVDLNRENLREISSVRELLALLAQEKSLINDLAAYAADQGIAQRPLMLRQATQRLQLQMHALIANHLFGATGFYQVITQGDPMISSAEQYLQENYHTR